MDNEREKPEIDRARRLLDLLLVWRKIHRHELDQAMGQGNGFTSQLLTGRVKLRLEHILQMLRELDVTPAVFFYALYPPTQEDRANRWKIPGPVPVADEPEAEASPGQLLDVAGVEKIVERVVDRTFERYFPDLAPSNRPGGRGGRPKKQPS